MRLLFLLIYPLNFWLSLQLLREFFLEGAPTRCAFIAIAGLLWVGFALGIYVGAEIQRIERRGRPSL